MVIAIAGAWMGEKKDIMELNERSGGIDRPSDSYF